MAMRRSWIMTADELHSMKKADFDATKEFITKTSDMIRLPYDKEMQEYQRHCVIWGTTNDPTFLRRQEGNRRFLPVHAEHAVDFEALTDDYVDQVWAEAVTLYREGNERLYLDTEESEVAELERDKYTEESPKMGLIEEYVSRLYPADWFDRTLDSRQMYLDHGPQDMMPEDVPVMQLDTVCAMQIWVEAMGQRRGDHKPFELKQITDELHRLEGWRLWPGKKAVPGYGRKVQVWVRESSLSDDVKNDLELI
jgi:putative DNA primase/helicase